MGDVCWKVGDTQKYISCRSLSVCVCVCVCGAAQQFFVLVQVLYPEVRG